MEIDETSGSRNAGEVGREERATYRIGGSAAMALGIGYVVTMAVYATVGPPPTDGEAWLIYSAGKSSAWWAIVGLAILTDLLFIPVAFALYLLLRRVSRNAMAMATALVLLFVVLDLAVTQANFAALITLSGDYQAASTEADRAAILAAATYATAVISSTVGIYSIVVLATGEMVLGIVMLRSDFSRAAAVVAIAAGVLGILSVAGASLAPGVRDLVIASSVLTTLWVLLLGYRLFVRGRP